MSLVNKLLARVPFGSIRVLFLLAVAILAGCARVDYEKMKDERFVTSQGAPSNHLTALLRVTKAPRIPATFKEVFELVQGWSDQKITVDDQELTYSWMRPRERFDAMPMARVLSDKDAETVVQILGDMGLLRVTPIPEDVGHIILAGSTLTKMRELLNFINAYVAEHPHVKVWVLAGERALSDSAGETQEKLHDPDNGAIPFRSDYVRTSKEPITDERDMAKLIVEQSFLGNKDNITVITARKSPGAPRATTMDTIHAFLSQNPPAGKYAFVSSPPFLERQTILIKALLNKGSRADISLVGAGPDPKIREAYNRYSPSHVAAIGLDELARVMYTLMQ